MWRDSPSLSVLAIMIKKHLALATLCASLAVVTAGCSLGAGPTGSSSTPKPQSTGAASGGSSQPAATKVDPCALVTQAEAATALGADPGPGTKDDGVHCAYHAGGDLSLNGLLASSFPSNTTDFASLRNATKSSGNSAQLLDFQDVSGVGDAAFATIGKTGNPGGTIVVLKGGSYIEIGFNSSATDPGQVLGILTTLGKTAAGRV